MSQTKLLPCSCKNEYQDKRYGDKRRVHNKLKTDKNNEKFRCAVCGLEK